MDAPRYRILGTAGHIDHGKSTLVLALTGIDPDRLEEEKKRGITIDLGFADVTIGGLHVGFIDVPGHERFVKNMLAGIGGIDAVLLVVAADESIMPQTREHFAICRLLGVERGVVAITKCDMVDAELAELVELEVQELLEGTALEGATIVRTSATTGDGVEELREAIGACLAGAPDRPAAGLLRLPVDRVFSIRGFGTVATGTLLSGQVRVGDRLEVLPGGRPATVRGIQVHGENAEAADAGQRVALNLHGIQTDDLQRGQVLARPGTLDAVSMIDVRVEVLANAEPLQHDQRVRFHHGAAEVLGRIATLDGDAVEPGASGAVQIRLELPYPAAPGDRFVLRRYSPVATLGGGTVIDLAPRRHRNRAAAARRLERLEAASAPERLALLVQERGDDGVSFDDLQRRLVVSAEKLQSLVSEAAADGLVRLLPGTGDRVVDPAAHDRLQSDITRLLGRYHTDWPMRPAMPKEELRATLAQRPSVIVLEAAAHALVERDEIRQAADGYALASHLARVPPPLAGVRSAILKRYEGAGLAPPSTEEALAHHEDGAAAREIYHHMLREGTLVRVRDDLVLHHENLDKLIDGLRNHFERGAQFSVADFKDWAGITRKHAIPLLEHLDSLRITRRVGDARERV